MDVNFIGYFLSLESRCNIASVIKMYRVYVATFFKLKYNVTLQLKLEFSVTIDTKQYKTICLYPASSNFLQKKNYSKTNICVPNATGKVKITFGNRETPSLFFWSTFY